ncbi:hypothetical protein J3E69DRAFT_339512 [Trichoderma sp. SZMC 28015]
MLSFSVKPVGFTILQDSNDAELDIVFVHGLQGHAEKTWTYRGDQIQTKESDLEMKHKGHFILLKKFLKKKQKQTSPTPDKTMPSVFWPQDLLSKHESCNKARIMIYGYDSDIIKLVDKANFTSITSLGESLLNGLARMRVDKMYRPLMFITHSLGGLIVKSALNASFIRHNDTERDLRAVVESTFSIIFFGTPHRGSAYADFGLKVAKVASVLTSRPYNDNIVRNLAENTEILTKLRKDFESTLEHMIKRNGFESSTFQEDKGLSGIVNFQGKVVDDDSSEMGRNDRNDHINRNHIEMCKFYGDDDPEYHKVAGEIKRHILRLQNHTEEVHNRFLSSLQVLGCAADQRRNGIDEKTVRTLEWVYMANATKYEGYNIQNGEQSTLATWLAHDQDLFWITGRPGSGKSTVMKHIFESQRTLEFLNGIQQAREMRGISEQRRIILENSTSGSEEASHTNNEWCRIGLFITNRGSQNQRQWEPMLHGILLQLLKYQPTLIRDLEPYMSKIRRKKKSATNSLSSHETSEVAYEWTVELVEEALMYCKSRSMRPFKALIVLDGLDELEDDVSAQKAVEFLRDLVYKTKATTNLFKVCISSRPEQIFRDLFSNTWHFEVHNHTKGDIYRHVRQMISHNPRWRSETLDLGMLKDVTEYISDNAQGVFLWAHSVATMVNEGLSRREPVGGLIKLLQDLPTDMNELYKYTLRRVQPELRCKAFIMLEVVLRTQRPMTLLELFLIVQVVESRMAGNESPWSSARATPTTIINDFNNPVRLLGQLIASCKCMLEISNDYHFDSWYMSDQGSDQLSVMSIETNEGEIEEYDVLHHEIILQQKTEVDQSDDDENIDVELMTRAQYRDYNGDRALDPARDVVRLLHRSAKDFLLKHNFLDALFPPGEHTQKPQGNGHSFILLFARAWFQFPLSLWDQIRCQFQVIPEIAFHAAQLESTMDASEAATIFPVLDDIDRQAAIKCKYRECWPVEWFYMSNYGKIDHWHFTFPAFASAMDMRGYMAHRIRKAEDINDLNYFLNLKNGRPLLHFSVYLTGQEPKPKMTEFLLDQGADANAKFEDKTAIESLVLGHGPSACEPHLNIMKLLIERGANPNSRYYPHGDNKYQWYPLLHIVAHDYGMDVSQRVDFMKLLYSKGADLNSVDSNNSSFLEVLYSDETIMPADEWDWLLNHKAKITKTMVSSVLDRDNANNWGKESTERYRIAGLVSDNESEGDVWETSEESSARDGSPPQPHQTSLMRQFSAWGSRDLDLYRSPGVGLCDKGGQHDALKILCQRRFRRRDWYESDAAALAESLQSDWFGH